MEGSFMTFFDEVSSVERVIDDAWRLPVPGKIVLDEEKLRQQLRSLADKLPDHFQEALEIVNSREQILQEVEQSSEKKLRLARKKSESIINKAQNDAAEIIAEAERRARAMVDNQEILRQAKEEAISLRESAYHACDKLIRSAEDEMRNTVSGLLQVRENLKLSAKKAEQVDEESPLL